MLRDQLGRTPRGRYRSAMILLRKMKLPEEIQWTSSTAHHKLGPTPDRAHAVQLPVVHLGLDVRLLQFCLKSKLCMVPSPLAAIRWWSSIFIKPLESHHTRVPKSIIPYLNKPILVASYRDVGVQAGADIQGRVMAIQVLVLITLHGTEPSQLTSENSFLV